MEGGSTRKERSENFMNDENILYLCCDGAFTVVYILSLMPVEPQRCGLSELRYVIL